VTRFGRLLVLAFGLAIWAFGLGAAILSAEKPTGSIVGRVVGHDTRPIAGARVYLHGENGATRVVQTAEDGSYRADRLPVDTYRLQARKRGFDAQWREPEVTLTENALARDVDFALEKRQPAAHFAQYQRVYLPDEKLRVGTRGSLVDSLDLTLYRLDVDRLLAAKGEIGQITEWDREGERAAAGELPPAIPAEAVSAIATWSASIPRGSVDEDDWFYRPVEVPAQPEGTYLLVMRATDGQAKLRDAFWFNVTRLALVTKRSKDQILVYAADFQTKRPLPDVELRVYQGTQVAARGRTGLTGLWQGNLVAENAYLTVAGRAGASFAHVAAYHGSSDRLAVLTYTDRPIYRPGHKVHFKGILRDRRGARPSVPAAPSVTVWARDPDGTELPRRTLAVSAVGTYQGDVDIPAEGHTGGYSLVTEVSGERYYSYFEVQAYRKPEFKVDVKPAEARVVGGTTQKVAVTATYYFGAPVVGARVRYTVFSRPEYPGWTEEDAFYSGYAGDDADPSGGEVVTEGEATTDEAGHLSLEIPTAKIAPADEHSRAYDQKYLVEVESEDQSRRLVKGRSSFLVTRGLFDLETDISTYLVKAGEPVRVTVSTRDYDGKPVRAKVSLRLERQEWVRPEEPGESWRTVYENAGTRTVETDAQGHAVAELRAPRAGSYAVHAAAPDSLGNTISAQSWFWASADEAAPTESYGSLGVTFDKKTYEVGDVAQVLITSPVPDLTLLVTLEGHRIHEARVIHLQGSAVRFEIPITREFQPNIWIDATAVNGKELLSTGKSLNVMPGDRFLTVTVEPDRDRYLPGAPARVRVKATDFAGKPVSGAEVSLGVVDEAIYALAPDRTPDLRRFFHGPRSSDVSTFHSFSTDYSGGPAKDLGDVKIRKNFKDTAAWFPSLVTGPGGVAEAAFDLPDNLTTWVCTARAVTAQTQVGATTKTFLATKDLLVRLETPRFFTQGDSLDLLTITHNYTKADQEVGIALDPGLLQLSGERERTASIAAGGAFRAEFRVVAEAVGTASVQVAAGNRQYSDGMKLDVPVLPFGLPQARTWAGEVSGAAVVEFEVPAAAMGPTVRFAVDVAPSPWSVLLAGIDYLLAYPYWCTEQTTSRLVPAAMVYRQLPAGDPRKAALEADIQAATRKLLALQHAQGWGWWETGDDEVEMTAYGLWGLTAARAAGVAVDEQRFERGLASLAEALPRIKKDTPRRYLIEAGTGPDTRAMGLWGMYMVLGSPRPPRVSPRFRPLAARELDRLWADRAGLTTYGKAVFASALVLADHPRAGRALIDLDQQAAQSANLAHWEAGGGLFSWSNSNVEATAHALLAHLARDPGNPLVAKAERWLELNRKRDRWTSTKDTAVSLVAIAAYTRQRATGAVTEPYVVEMSLDDTPVASAVADPGSAGRPLTFALGGVNLPAGRHKVALAAPPHATPLYGAELRYFEQARDIPARAGEIVAIAREYFAIPKDLLAEARTMTPSGLFGEKTFHRLIPAGGRARPGDRLVARVRVTTTQDVRFAVIEDPLPSGAEVLLDESGDDSYWWNHRDVLDDKVVFFADTLTKGQPHDFYYVLRPELIGSFRVLPPVVEAMYAPDIRAHGAAARLEVAE